MFKNTLENLNKIAAILKGHEIYKETNDEVGKKIWPGEEELDLLCSFVNYLIDDVCKNEMNEVESDLVYIDGILKGDKEEEDE